MTDRQNTEIDSNLASTQTCDLSVRNMRKGYKKTKLGWIPEDWVVTELGKIGQVVSGLTYSPQDVNDNGTLVLRSSNVQKENLSFEDTVYVDTDGLSYNPVIENDILICVRNGSKHLIGKNTLITKEVEGVAFGAFMSVFRSDLNNYLIQYFKTDIYNREIHKNLGATINSINGSELKRFKVPLPPRSERQKIATILSTWDRAIAKQEQLISAKHEFKKGLMQLLLSGKKRFEEFEDEWVILRLKDVFALTSGKSKPINTVEKQTEVEIYPVYGGNGISGFSNEYLLQGYNLLIGRVGEYCGVVHLINGKYWITDNCLYTINFQPNNSKYFFYYFLTYLELNRLKNKGGQPLVSQKPILSYKVKIPRFNEQQKIAFVLSAADKEIGLLQSELARLRGQKRGLMQVLLTGKKRVQL